MPITAVAEVLEIPVETLYSWLERGWISTDADWQGKGNEGKRKASPARAAQLVKVKGYTRQEAAAEMGVCASTIRRYLEDYKKGAHDA
jgi:DNA-directed RNA polymerase specialized sigma24 family protein